MDLDVNLYLRRRRWFIKSPEFDIASAFCSISLESHMQRNDLNMNVERWEKSDKIWPDLREGPQCRSAAVAPLFQWNAGDFFVSRSCRGTLKSRSPSLWCHSLQNLDKKFEIETSDMSVTEKITYSFQLETDKRGRPEGSHQSSSCKISSLSLWIFWDKI